MSYSPLLRQLSPQNRTPLSHRLNSALHKAVSCQLLKPVATSFGNLLQPGESVRKRKIGLFSEQVSPFLTSSVDFEATLNCQALIQSPFRNDSFKTQRRRLYRRDENECSDYTKLEHSDSNHPSTEKSHSTFTLGESSNHSPAISDIDFLGRGEFGVVFTGHYNDRKVAIKKLYKRAVFDSTTARMELMRSELNAFKVKHRNIARLVAFTNCGNTSEMVYEYVGGRNLQTLLDDEENEPFDSARRLLLLGHISDALGFCHRMGLLHLDVKPANILVTDDGRCCKLGDFGSSQMSQGRRAGARGTLIYMPPELLKGQSPCRASDVYSFSLVAWQFLSRRRPFAHLHPHSVVFLVVARRLRPDTNTLTCHPMDEADRRLVRLIDQCWADDPRERPAFDSISRQLLAMSVWCLIFVE